MSSKERGLAFSDFMILAICMVILAIGIVNVTETRGIKERKQDKLLIKCEDGSTEWVDMPVCKM